MTHHTHDNETEHTAHGGHEPNDISLRVLIGTGIGLVVLVVVSGALMYFMFQVLAGRGETPTEVPDWLSEVQQQRTEPELDHEKRSHKKDLRRTEDKVLNGSEWLDEELGVARIPVRRAMEILQKRGFSPPDTNEEQP